MKILKIIVILGMAILIVSGAFCLGYYFGWTQEHRFENRRQISDVWVSTLSLDSIYKYECIPAKHFATFETRIDLAIINYVQSRDGGSLGLNALYLDNNYDNSLKRTAKKVAEYRLRHPTNIDWCKGIDVCKELLEKHYNFKEILDSKVQYILNEQ